MCCTFRRSQRHHTENIVSRNLKKYSANLTLLMNEFSTLLDECSGLIDVLLLTKDSKRCANNCNQHFKYYFLFNQNLTI